MSTTYQVILTRADFRSVRLLPILAILALAFDSYGQRTPTVQLPPGISIPQEIAASPSIPPHMQIDEIDVDWTHPKLVVSLEVGDDGRTWEDIGRDHPEALRIQLAVIDEASGITNLPVSRPEPRRRTSEANTFLTESIAPARPEDRLNRVHVGGISPWTFTGPGTATLPGWSGDLSVGGIGVALQWLGTGEKWTLAPPDFQFGERVILSTLNPLTGQGRFFLVQNQSGRPQSISSLTPWIRDSVSGQHLLAVHAAGADVEIGHGTWRLGGPGKHGANALAGAVLILRERQAGEIEDLARDHAARATASSYQFAYPPSQVVSGRLWPVALRPPVWLSREALQRGDRSGEADWVDLELPHSALVSELRLVHLGAAGWSPGFNPGELEVHLRTQKDFEAPERISLNPRSSVSLIRFSSPREVLGVRVVFSRPTSFQVPSSAGLMALQVWGRPEGSRPPR